MPFAREYHGMEKEMRGKAMGDEQVRVRKWWQGPPMGDGGPPARRQQWEGRPIGRCHRGRTRMWETDPVSSGEPSRLTHE